MTIDYKHFEKKLNKEKEELEQELSKVGRQNPDRPSDWQPVPTERDTSQADDNTVADSVEDFDENTAIVNTLEKRYSDVLSGLDKIKEGTFGVCQVCGEEIEEERLEANPAARTCRKHM